MKVKIGPYLDQGEQEISVRIDDYDTWSMDYTLAHIILPMLQQLKNTNQGYPSELTEEEWDGIQDKMIWAFEEKIKDDIHSDHKRMDEGFRLFGRFYQNLWV